MDSKSVRVTDAPSSAAQSPTKPVPLPSSSSRFPAQLPGSRYQAKYLDSTNPASHTIPPVIPSASAVLSSTTTTSPPWNDTCLSSSSLSRTTTSPSLTSIGRVQSCLLYTSPSPRDS
eukprot:TRINITY_DN11147_c0_g3_i1.p1 TRINITY_DN11147_c0_g3~~TRINITY_DN11147_c0_g3_i1.p1  ORF type:complete len:117 (-),score=16.68 TRINITY_DN11147_c0_g3_i1:111-461(-)